MRNLLFVAFIGCTVILIGCKNDHVPFETTPYNETFPFYFPEMPVSADNPTTVEGVELGRMLYYDEILHSSQSKACASCHDQSNSFTTPESNCLPHLNIGWASSFLWNGEVEGSLEDIMMFEVDDFFETDVSLLNNHPDYPALFKRAFNVETITSREIAYALAQFFRTMNSYNSKYDQRMLGLASLTPEEYNGYDIFFTERGDCFHCHGGALFTDNLFHNNALDVNPESGRFTVTNNSADVGKFKTPTLRNVEVTGPYMHDGRFLTLEEVVDFYSEGLQNSSTVDPLMKKIAQGGINLDPQEKQDLVAFLKTLTDTSYLNNPALSNPFE